jgi:hypothetical protein
MSLRKRIVSASCSRSAAEIIPADPARGGFPLARLAVDRESLGLSGYDFIRALIQGRPSIHPGERELDRGAVIIHPFGLQDGDEQAIVRRVKEIVGPKAVESPQ